MANIYRVILVTERNFGSLSVFTNNLLHLVEAGIVSDAIEEGNLVFVTRSVYNNRKHIDCNKYD